MLPNLVIYLELRVCLVMEYLCLSVVLYFAKYLYTKTFFLSLFFRLFLNILIRL